MALKHTRLPLGGERIEEEKETKEHDASPGSRCLLVIDVVSESDLQVIGGCHEHGNANSYSERNVIIVLRVFRVYYKCV